MLRGLKGRVRRLTLLAGVFALAAAACGSGAEETTTTAAPAADPTTTAAPAATEAPATTAAPAATEASTTTAAAEEMPETRAYTAEELVDAGVEPGSGAGLKIGYISLGESIPFVKLVSDSIREQTEAAGAEFVFCDSEVDPAKALECARTLAVQQVDVLINFQLFEDAAAQICEEGPQVPVVSIDIHQRPCEITFFGADNHAAGFMTGGATAKHIEANYSCEYDEFILLNADAAGEVVKIRGEGAVEGFEAVCGAIPDDKYNYIDVPSIAVDEARENTSDWLIANPDAEVVALASTNDDMLLGALAAFRNAGREEAFWGTAQGADESSWIELECNEHWVADTAYFPERYGRTAVPAAIALAKGNTVPNPLSTPHVVLTNNPAIAGADEFPTAPFTDFYPAQDCG